MLKKVIYGVDFMKQSKSQKGAQTLEEEREHTLSNSKILNGVCRVNLKSHSTIICKRDCESISVCVYGQEYFRRGLDKQNDEPAKATRQRADGASP